MPAQLANGGPPRRAFAASSSQDYEEGHFQQHAGGAPGSGWQDSGSGDAFLGSAAKTTGASGTGLANGLEKRGSATARRPSNAAPSLSAGNLPFNSFAPHRRPASPQAGSSAGPFDSLLVLVSGVKNDLLSSSSTGLVGNVKCAYPMDGDRPRARGSPARAHVQLVDDHPFPSNPPVASHLALLPLVLLVGPLVQHGQGHLQRLQVSGDAHPHPVCHHRPLLLHLHAARAPARDAARADASPPQRRSADGRLPGRRSRLLFRRHEPRPSRDRPHDQGWSCSVDQAA
jgi:hypothetical protein